MMKTTNVKTESVASKSSPVSKIKIHGKVFDVKPFTDPLSPTHALGYNDVRIGVIQYEPKAHIDVVKDTFLHEIIHIIDYDCQTEMTERQVHCVATGLYSVLKDNPEFAKWIIK